MIPLPVLRRPWPLATALLVTACAGAPPRTVDQLTGPRDPVEAAVLASDPTQDTVGTELTAPLGIGLTASPSTFLLTGAVDVPVAENWSVGPALEIGVSDNRTLLAPTFQVKRYFPVHSRDGDLDRLMPFVQGGAGFAYLEKERGGRDDDEIGVLIDVGGGVRYRIGEDTSLGSQILFHFLPDEVVDERFYFSWEVVQLVLHF